MKKAFLSFFIFVSIISAYDFGNVPEKHLDEIEKLKKPLMVMVGKTECIWCESMAPQIKEILESYPKTPIYYFDVETDILASINRNISELPVQLFYDENGKEVGRHTGYMGKEEIIEYLQNYGILGEE